MTAKRRFQLVLIKPSHYDDDGYVIRWWRTIIPSNSLAAIYGIAADCAERQVLGPDVAFDITVIDETNTSVDAPALLARLRCQRSRYRAAVPERRDTRRYGRFSCVGVPLDA